MTYCQTLWVGFIVGPMGSQPATNRCLFLSGRPPGTWFRRIPLLPSGSDGVQQDSIARDPEQEQASARKVITLTPSNYS